MPVSKLKILEHPLVRRYTSLVREDLAATYRRDLHKWLIVGPIMGVIAGLLISLVAAIILLWIWPPVLHLYLAHQWLMIPGLALGFLIAGLIMQYLTHDPDEHSTEEIIKSYHQHQGDIDPRPFIPKLLAAIATVACGGSAALEGPSIYGGGAVGSWLWTVARRFKLEARDRRIMLIAGAAAGMSAVFRAPLTGIVFALEMPYKDDLAHEALLPALVASVVSYATMAPLLGATPLFNFQAAGSYTRHDLLWSALLGVLCGGATMIYTITFRRFRRFCIRLTIPHWLKMLLGGVLTAACGLLFVTFYRDGLVPLGPNYEAVGLVLNKVHSSLELMTFGVLKLLATLFSLGVGGVSAAFVPFFLTGGTFGTAFGQSIVHSALPELYAAVGMAAFLAGGYKAPLTAVVFVAETTGGHAFIVPTLIGAAIAYAVSGEASMSSDQRLHEGVKIAALANVPIREIMQTNVVPALAGATLAQFVEHVGRHDAHPAYPVLDGDYVIGVVSVGSVTKIPPDRWNTMHVRDAVDAEALRVPPDTDVEEALRLLLAHHRRAMLLVIDGNRLEGIVTKTDILAALDTRGAAATTAIPAAAG
ncbi:MAG TPA: chloride channel protein [Gemmatimonadaceae bacterium]|nr:chloride channel protein [Gemmatimonadaceae bacterium]